MYTPVKERENKSFGYTPVAQRSGFTETPISSGISLGTKTSTPQTIEQGSISKFTSGVGSFLKQAPLGRVITAIKENKSITEVAKAILPTERERVSLDDPEKIVELAFNFLPVGMVNRAKKASQIAKEAYEAQQLLRKTGGGIDSLPKQLSNEARDIVVKSFEKPKVDVTDFKPTTTLQQEAKKFKTTINIKDKNDLDYLRRILSEDNIKDIQKGKMTNFRGTSYEDLAKVNIISEIPKSVEQQLAGKISVVKLKSDTFYHGTSADSAKEIIATGFKKGSELPEDVFRGGGYGKIQDSISFSETPKEASIFSTLSKGGEIVEVKLKPKSKVVSIKGIEDANDLEDFLPYLRKQKIDAVYIGGGEKELVVINTKSVTPTKPQLKDIYNKAKGVTDEIPKIKVPSIKKAEVKVVKSVPFSKLNEIVEKLKSRDATEELFDNARLELGFANEALENNPAKQLVKYMNRKTGELPEVVGGVGKSTFARRGDDIVTELGFKDSEQAREAVQTYLQDKTRLENLRDTVKSVRKDMLDIRKGEKLIKTSFKERRMKLRAVQNTFQLNSQDMAKIRRNRDITAMSERDFNDYLFELENKGFKEFKRSEALIDLKTTIFEKEIDVENLRKAMKLPSIKNMTIDDIKKLDEALQPFYKGDEFLSVRKLEVVDRTDLKGIKTWREARENLAKKLGVKVEDLNNIKVSEFDRFKYDTSLAETNPFYGMMVEETASKMLVSEAEFLKLEQKILGLAKKLKPEGFLGRIIPQQKKIRQFMETPVAKQGEIKLTKPEQDIVTLMTKEFDKARDYLVQMEAIKVGKDNYFTHIRRGILEATKEDGIIKAVKELFEQYKLEEQTFNILDKQTGDILAMDKFFKFSMHRTGGLKPTENTVKAFLTYMRTFKKKQALDEIVPLIDIYAHSLTPKGMTDKGLLLHGNLQKFVKEWLNTKKGRHITLVAKQNGKIDATLRVIKMFTSLRDLALNIPVSVASEVGEQITTYQLLGKKRFALGKIRQNTKQGKKIIEEYRNLIGKDPWKELIEPSKEAGDRLMEGIFILFRDASTRANKTFLLGSLSKKELQSGIISPERLSSLRTELGRYRMFHGMKSIIGATPEGGSYTQYKTWAIPILRTTTKNLTNLAKKITFQKVGSDSFKKSLVELYRLSEITALVMLTFGIVRDENDNSFIGQILNKAYREATTLIQALQPKMFLTAGRTASFITKLGENLTLILKMEEYKTKKGLKGVAGLKKQLTPVAVSNLKKETKTKGIGLPSLPKLPSLPSLPELPSLPSF